MSLSHFCFDCCRHCQNNHIKLREASSKSRSLSSDDHIQPVLHAPSRKLPPRPSSPPPGFVGLYSHHPHTSAQSSNQPHDGAPNAGVRWLTPPGPHAYAATPTTTTLLSTVATPAEGCNTYASPVPVHVPKQRTDPYVYMQATTKAAPPLPGPDLHRVIGAHQLRCWSHFGKQLTLLSKLVVANCKTAAVQVANSRLLLRTMRRYHRRRHHQPFLFQQQQQRNQHRSQHS